MRAAAFGALTGPDGVELVDRPWPTASGSEAVVSIEACAVNRHDLWILNGDSAMVSTDELPFVSGLDVAGTVTDVGADVTEFEPGDRVLLCPNQTCGTCRYCRDGPETHCASFSLYHGGFAEAARVNANRLLRVPDGVSMIRAAALPTAYLTAFHMLRLADVTAGDTVFVPGVTGGVGVAAVQLAASGGAATIGTSRSSSKLDAVKDLGLDHGIQSADPDEIVEAADAMRPVDVALDHLGGPFTRCCQGVIRRNGVIVVCGRTAGSDATLDVPGLFLDHQRILGSTMGTQPELDRLLSLVASGALVPGIDRTFPLEKTDEAFRRLDARAHVGKIVITP